MKSKEHSQHNNKVTIYHHEINLEYEHHITFFLITEMEDGEPHRTYYYKIPDNYKDNSLLGEIHERYCPYCPN